MSVKKMNLVNIIGPIGKFDGVLDKYIADCNIHLQDAVGLGRNTNGLYKFGEANPFVKAFRRVSEICEFINIPLRFKEGNIETNNKTEEEYLEHIFDEYRNFKNKVQEFQKSVDDNNVLINQLGHMINWDINLEDMFNFEFMRFRFGRMSKESYTKLTTFLSDIETYFVRGNEEEGYVYGMYLTPHICRERVDSVFASLNFERIRISDKARGNPSQAITSLEKENEELISLIEQNKKEIISLVNENSNNIIHIYSSIKRKYDLFNIREKSVRTQESFYIMGWMSEKETKKLRQKILELDDVIIMVEEAGEVERGHPPTQLSNKGIFKFFESFVKMYGLPSYNELDPTRFLSITYVIIFGIMFGDVGQGAVLAILGALLYFKTKNDLMGIVGTVGISSTFFGFIYGSIFGNDSIIKGLWIKPLEDTNRLLITAIAIGIVLIVSSMIFNIINAIKAKDFGKVMFSQNGIAGMIFYIASLYFAYSAFTTGGVIPIVGLVLILGIPLLLIFLQQPLSALVAKRSDWIPKNKGEFFIEAFFELFEILLNYATNTISFIRIGAFALVHASMMMVVYEFSHMAGSTSSIFIIILGNAFVMMMEGFIVGIQALRLEFYEMFGRFFTGEGRAFKPFDLKESNNKIN